MSAALALLLLAEAATKAHHHAIKPAAAASADDSADPAAEESEHIVKDGETLGGVAHRAKVPRIIIIEANGLKAPYGLHSGQTLALPRTRRHKVKPGETGFDIAYKYGVPFSAIAVASGIKADATLQPGQLLLIPTVLKPKPAPAAADTAPDDSKAPEFSWPLAGKVVRSFSPRSAHNYHDGLDIQGPAGTAVRASAAGTVIFAGQEPQSFGNLVVVDHGHGWQSAYGFLAKLTVTKGDAVKSHERVGLLGHTGKATRDELHFELRKDNLPVDPDDQLPEVGKKAANNNG